MISRSTGSFDGSDSDQAGNESKVLTEVIHTTTGPLDNTVSLLVKILV